MRATTIEGQNAFAPTLCLEQISCPFHSFLVEVQMNAGYILDPSAYGSGNARVTTYVRMRNNNLEIRIAGSSCRLQ